ncbi:hypothetical protein COW46_03935 [Candidatus Gracilibacteria bacterium CG17_big_fil_post_rev_8_21_14_2_50_48_13]|nr:MAG: hypothetical protein COW46_03935 [Candidatus Gracilibacteria bacterium CG17_big_fil_post_rev_8_21_14_2_50_48_13]
MRRFSYPYICFVLVSAFLLAPLAHAEEWAWTTPTPGTPNEGVIAAPHSVDLAEAVPIASMTVIVSEVFASGSKASEEFVELYNYGKEPIDLSGLVLKNASGKRAVIASGTRIASMGYVVLEGQLPIVDSGDRIALLRGNEELDVLEFTGEMMKERGSVSRYCDVYELRFCEVKATVPTPMAENRMERLTVRAIPENGILRPGQKASFEANMPGAKIILSRSASGSVENALTYDQPLRVDSYVTYWFYAQWEGQATVPQKISFRVDPSLPDNATFEANTGLKISEIYLDRERRTGWVEIQQSGTKPASLRGIELDTRADQQTFCTTCSVLEEEGQLAPGEFLRIDLSKKVVASLLARTTPVTFSLRFAKEKLDAVTVVLMAPKRPYMSLLRATPYAQEEEPAFVWTDIPTPAAENVAYRIDDLLPVGDRVSKLLFVEGGYEDAVAVLQGKSVPGYTIDILDGNGVTLASSFVAKDGQWSARLPKNPVQGEVFFQLRYGDAMPVKVTHSYTFPAFDAGDAARVQTPKNSTTKLVSTVKASNTTKVGAAVDLATSSVPDLASMTGVVLSAVRTNYAIGSVESIVAVRDPRAIEPIAAFMDALSLRLSAILFPGM